MANPTWIDMSLDDATLPREMEEVWCVVNGAEYRAYFMDGLFIAAVGEVFKYEEVSKWRQLVEA